MTVPDPEYTEITVLTHPDAVEGVTDVLLDLGVKGIAEERHPLSSTLTAYLPADDSLDDHVRRLRQRLSDLERTGLRIGPGTVRVRTLETKAWSETWKEYFQILKVTPGLTIVPGWEEYKAEEGEFVIVLEPGAAFGTGGHATTRLCLRSIVQHIRPGDRVADVGCGSGILAITAAALGARKVIATDNDRLALEAARANAQRNRVATEIQLMDVDLLTGVSGQFDLIVCNIVAEEVIRLAEQFPRLLRKSGRCIASGFVTDSLSRIEDAFIECGLRILETPSEGGWAACVGVRPERSR